MTPLALFGTYTLLFLFPLGAPRQGGAPWFIYTVTLVFVAGVIASAIPGIDSSYSSSLLSACTILAYARTWIRIGNEQPWLARIGAILFPKPFTAFVALSLQLVVPGEPAVLWPSRILLVSIVALGEVSYAWLLIAAAVGMQGMSGRLAVLAAAATGLGLSRFGHPAAAAAGLTSVAVLLARRQLRMEKAV